MRDAQMSLPSYEPARLFIVGTVRELTQIGDGNPKDGPIMDGNNMNGLGKTSIWP